MSHFYADIQGNRGKATRQGTKESGIEGHVRGWDMGVRVICTSDEATGRDVCSIYLTSGSNNPSEKQCIAEVRDVLMTDHREKHVIVYNDKEDKLDSFFIR